MCEAKKNNKKHFKYSSNVLRGLHMHYMEHFLKAILSYLPLLSAVYLA